MLTDLEIDSSSIRIFQLGDFPIFILRFNHYLALTEAKERKSILIPFVLDSESRYPGIEAQAFLEVGHADFRNQTIEFKGLLHDTPPSVRQWTRGSYCLTSFAQTPPEPDMVSSCWYISNPPEPTFLSKVQLEGQGVNVSEGCKHEPEMA
jgi:hypothetical protein